MKGERTDILPSVLIIVAHEIFVNSVMYYFDVPLFRLGIGALVPLCFCCCLMFIHYGRIQRGGESNLYPCHQEQICFLLKIKDGLITKE